MSRFGISPYVAGGHTTYVGRGGSYLRTTPGGGAVYGSPYGAAVQPGRVDQFNGSGYGGYMPAPSTTPLNDQISQSRGMIPRPPTAAAAPRITPARMSIPIPPGYGEQQPMTYEQRKEANFAHSLDVTREQKATDRAGANTFAQLKAGGMDDATARRQSYLSTHPAGGMMPPPPATAGTAPAQQPNGQLPVGVAAPQPPTYSKDQVAAQGRFYRGQLAQAKTALGSDPSYASPEAQAAYKKAQDDYNHFLRQQGGLESPERPPVPTPGTYAPVPSASPTIPLPPTVAAPRQQMEAGTKADIPLTAEIINAMHQANGGDATRTVQTLTGYGYDTNQATDVMAGMQGNGQLIPPPPTYTPGIRMPLSMLGPSNGMDPSQNYGFARQATAGPTIQTPGTFSPGSYSGATPVARPPKPEGPGIAGAGKKPHTYDTPVTGGLIEDGKPVDRVYRQPTVGTTPPRTQPQQPQQAQASAAAPSDADVNYTAQKYGITPAEVRRRLGL